MTRQELIEKLTPIFEEVLEENHLKLHESTTAENIASWDSVNHLVLLNAIEQSFNIKFSLEEIINFRQVGDICSSILEKLPK